MGLSVLVDLDKPRQAVEGFGACFNELGWTSLSALSPKQRHDILRELFAPGVGANLTICRMPVGANDFSRGWYSYDETPDDFALDHFGIDNDLETLIPFIKGAQEHQPDLKLWASPWSPPTWMKRNKHYACVQRPSASLIADHCSSPSPFGLLRILVGLTRDTSRRVQATDLNRMRRRNDARRAPRLGE